MSVIHRTTMTPTKLELLQDWLPTRPWYPATGGTPVLEKAGGFRLDDPEGEVGIEFMVVRDASAADRHGYLVPLTYRGAPLEGAEQSLVGTSEHGVLGTRYVYDGTHDPVLLAELRALLRGRAEPQAQSESDTPDPKVTATVEGDEGWAPVSDASVTDGPDGTVIRFGSGAPELRVVRVLGTGEEPAAGARGAVTAWWLPAEGEERTEAFVVVRDAP
ncbi:maltokinase N-terminal cap-like domain-containing protein [Streptomyces roseoviridis]|uniref:maltokinase N-terminal cap-like domain-containing protein n=1 Tax=Streptomyces roseoviridis TaxID=67361 RepID=UPI0031E865C1